MIFKDLFDYFHENELFTKCQSGFLPGDSCISQLLSIVHDIKSSFDCDSTLDVRGIFSDISKAFDKVFAIHDPAGVKLLSRLQLKFSHLYKHKFRHNFKNALSPMCDWGSETETTDHFFLRCLFF